MLLAILLLTRLKTSARVSQYSISMAGVQFGEPYRRQPRKTVESTSDDDEDETESAPLRTLLFLSDGEDTPSPVKEKKLRHLGSGKKQSGNRICSFTGWCIRSPGDVSGTSSSKKKKKLNLLFPNPDKKDSPFVKRMKAIQTNGPRFGDNVVYMEQLEAMNDVCFVICESEVN